MHILEPLKIQVFILWMIGLDEYQLKGFLFLPN